jgi:pyruvate formate lyase activating enzyme
MNLTRRDLLAATARALPALGGASLAVAGLDRLGGLAAGSPAHPLLAFSGVQDLLKTAPRARFWTTAALAGQNCLQCHTPSDDLAKANHAHNPTTVKCLLCAQGCGIKAGQRGQCRVRMNVNGELRSLSYGRPVAIHVDPIEKKPFFHFLPGAAAYSLGTAGCPLRCKFCQNWQLSQSSPEDFESSFVPPASLVATAAREAPVIAFTYNEPTVQTEYVLDVARDARKRALRSVMISCGFMNEAPLAEMCQALDAIKIDLKGFSESFYRSVCNAELQPVLRTIKQIAKSGVHLEIVNLVVPTLNDSDKSLQDLAGWVAGELGPDVPLHFSRFHPDYQLLNLPDTPIPTLDRARNIAMAKGINYVYVGNVPNHPGGNTYCPSCKKAVIERNSFFVTSMNIKDGRCAFCKRAIAGVWG